MNRHIAILLASLAALLLVTLSASAQDVRPMSEIDALIESASEGAVLVPPPGHYEGNLRIRKAVTIDGQNLVTFDGLGKGTVVEIRAKSVTLRNLTVTGSGDDVHSEPACIRAETGPVRIEGCTVLDAYFGIDLKESPDSYIVGNTVHGKSLDPERRGDGIRIWWSAGTTIEGNAVFDSRDMVFWYSENITVARNTVTNSRYGLHFMYSHNTTLTDNTLSGNSVGIYLMYSNSIRLTRNQMINSRGASGYGLGLKDCDDIIIEGNALLANRVGVYVDNSPSSIGSTGLFESNLIAFNEVGLLATPNTHDNVFTGNAFIENEESAATHGPGRLVSNTFERNGIGNYWSDYAGIDLDRDGVGDMPYEPRSLFGAMLSAEPNLRLFVHSPAQQAIEFTAKALPELRPEPALIDPAPLSQPPQFSLSQAADDRSSLGMFAVAGLLLIVGLGGAALLGRTRIPVIARKVNLS